MPKTPKQQLGLLGERYALSHLEKKGYRILEQNWRYRRTEIDLIAMQGECMVFVEVKTRSQDYFGGPTTTLSPQQEARLSRAAGAYMESVGHEWAIRFDLIGIHVLENGDYQIEHIGDAWWPRG